MIVVTDRGLDLAEEQLQPLGLHFAPLWLHFEGKTYSSGVDIQPAEFYQMLGNSRQYPTTSMASVQDFERLYRSLLPLDRHIISLHVSSALSGTFQAALAAAKLIPDADITVLDSRSLSALLGWQVEAVVRTLRIGWSKAQIIPFLERLRRETFGFFTVREMRYLVHSGRINFLRGMLASMLNIKPVIEVDQTGGKLVSVGRETTLRHAIEQIVRRIGKHFNRDVRLRAQIVHADNLPGVEMLRECLEREFHVQWEPVTPISPVLGAHGGPTIVGVGVARADLFEMD